MNLKPVICGVITSPDMADVQKIEALVTLFELRIDLVGKDWPEVARQLKKPWIACNRLSSEGGKWHGNETARQDELFKALQMGAAMVDIELATPSLKALVPIIKKRAKCLISFHDLKGTTQLENLKKIVQDEIAAGGDACKVVTTAQSFEDNLTLLKLISAFPQTKIVAFAMGLLGQTSRIMCPLVGGAFTYAAIKQGAESATGQLTVAQLHQIYEMMKL